MTRLALRYESDKFHYSTLFDESCEERSGAPLGNSSDRSRYEKSVGAFFAAGDAKCRLMGGSACPMRAKLVAEVRVLIEDGVVYLELLDVHSYAYE